MQGTEGRCTAMNCDALQPARRQSSFCRGHSEELWSLISLERLAQTPSSYSLRLSPLLFSPLIHQVTTLTPPFRCSRSRYLHEVPDTLRIHRAWLSFLDIYSIQDAPSLLMNNN